MKLDTSGLETFVSPSMGFNVLPSDFTASPAFDIPGCTDFDGFQKNAVQMVKPAKGTTTLAFIFKEGVIVAADSRASMGGYIFMGALGGFLGFVAWAFVRSFAA